jgi:hypothetical protein
MYPEPGTGGTREAVWSRWEYLPLFFGSRSGPWNGFKERREETSHVVRKVTMADLEETETGI